LRLVHGDYRLDNLLFARGGTAVLGVLDWELSTLGDPLADFAHHLLAWVMPPTLRGMAGANLPALGIPSQEEYTQRYLARSGLKPQASWAFYFGFCLFRLAAIGQGVAARARQGQGSSTNATQQGALARPAAELGWALAQQYQ
jgi:acyl-CoA dehydrogenase